MNLPPSTSVRIDHEQLHRFIHQVFEAAGMPRDDAELLGGLLAANDLRGVHSHGTHQILGYAQALRDRVVNPEPEIRLVRETPVSVQLDGDGGLGYFAAHEGTRLLVSKAQESGIGVLSTRNHGHIGAAGIYARMLVEHGLIAFVTSGHQMDLAPGTPYAQAGGNPPMCFGTPMGEEPPLIVDFGTSSDLHREELGLATSAPGIVFRCVGQAAVAHIWGGLLAGVPYGAPPADRVYAGATQGSLVIAIQVGLFVMPEEFEREIDAYAIAVKKMAPLEGFDACHHPGAIEAEYEREYRRDGIPVGPDHLRILEEAAAEYGVQVSW